MGAEETRLTIYAAIVSEPHEYALFELGFAEPKLWCVFEAVLETLNYLLIRNPIVSLSDDNKVLPSILCKLVKYLA